MSRNTAAAEIREDEQVVFFPTTARLDEDEQVWTARIHGWIFEPEEDSRWRNSALARLHAALGLSTDVEAAGLFKERARWLLVDNERGKQVEIQIGDRHFPLDRSAADGHFFGTIRLEADSVATVAQTGRLPFVAVTKPTDGRTFEGTVHLIPPRGTSVISDIDDTIKVSAVADRSELLRNTFLRPFRAVDGMARVYRTWAGQGIQFHLVSASPWQLYVPLASFAQETGFPPASYHLKRVRLKDRSVVGLFANPISLKRGLIEEILRDFPERQFILIGDSGERDPEIYGLVARDYPGQIRQIYIRDITDDPADGQRYEAAFADVPNEKWQLFRDPSALGNP